jgi:alkanesulfonate monooxygenase SsuD/methylene tetrahydromethanopterin reductase-like flavin-dependent oxidoreductase (luciferase family)
LEFGIFMPARVDAWPVVRRGEGLGFSHAWLYDSQMLYADTFACLALCAEHTERIKLGTGVTNPVTRLAPVMASALGTINQLAPGRVFMGIGTGYSVLRSLGLPPARVDDFREYIRVVRALTRGEVVEYTHGRHTRWIQMIHGEGSTDPTFMNFRHPIPIWVAANGPKAREVAGELGDGLIFSGRPTAEAVARVRDQMRPGAERAGRRAEDIPLTVFLPVYVQEPGEPFGSERMKRTVMGPGQSTIGLYAAGVRSGTTPQYGERLDDAAIPAHTLPLVREYRRLKAGVQGPARLDGPASYITAYEGHAWRLHPGLVPHVSEEALRARGAIIGPQAEVVRQIRELEAAGVGQLGVMLGDSLENCALMVERIGREVISKY